MGLQYLYYKKTFLCYNPKLTKRDVKKKLQNPQETLPSAPSVQY